MLAPIMPNACLVPWTLIHAHAHTLWHCMQAWDWGASGPIVRGSGIDWDLRKAQPYDAYGKMDFNVPVAGHGDSYDRYLVRLQVGPTFCTAQGAQLYAPHSQLSAAHHRLSPAKRIAAEHS